MFELVDAIREVFPGQSKTVTHNSRPGEMRRQRTMSTNLKSAGASKKPDLTFNLCK